MNGLLCLIAYHTSLFSKYLIIAWSKNDDLELLKFIRKACPENDNMKFHTRVDRLNWESVSYFCSLKCVKVVLKINSPDQ